MGAHVALCGEYSISTRDVPESKTGAHKFPDTPVTPADDAADGVYRYSILRTGVVDLETGENSSVEPTRTAEEDANSPSSAGNRTLP